MLFRMSKAMRSARGMLDSCGRTIKSLNFSTVPSMNFDMFVIGDKDASLEMIQHQVKWKIQ